MDPNVPQLEAWLAQILDRDAATFENAYWGIRPDVAEPSGFVTVHMTGQRDGVTLAIPSGG